MDLTKKWSSCPHQKWRFNCILDMISSSTSDHYFANWLTEGMEINGNQLKDLGT